MRISTILDRFRLLSRPSFRLLALAIVFTTAAASLSHAEERGHLLSARNSITANELHNHVVFLADDSLEGREAGKPGGHAAADHLVGHFRKAGLQGAGDDGEYLQLFGNGYRNVLGLLEGSDEELKKEIVLIGAHYDHVGYGDRTNSYGPTGFIHNGADDNASGVAGVLETLDAFLSLPAPPKRSLLFALWDGEEKGLLGSTHFLADPTVSRQRLVFALNVDMIGRMRNQRLIVYGSRSASGLRRLVAEGNQWVDVQLDFDWEMKSNSDHHSFFTRQIPVLMLHTGMHEDCHRPSDDAELINDAGMETASRLLFNLAYDIAERGATMRFRDASLRESPADGKRLERPMPPAEPRLGVRWSDEQAGEGLLLEHVERGSAAAPSGLRADDRLIQFNGRPVNDAEKFRLDVLAASSPVPVVVRRENSAEPLELSMELDGNPTRIGISWREDDAEPGTVLITRIIPGSPAELGSLRLGDRIYEVAGQRFNTSEAFYDLVTTLPSPLELTIERQGRIQNVTLELPPARQRRM